MNSKDSKFLIKLALPFSKFSYTTIIIIYYIKESIMIISYLQYENRKEVSQLQGNWQFTESSDKV